MNRQPPPFLERLVSRLIPAASREHVLGDLAERYRSPWQYIIDAARTLPFVVTGQLRRSGLAATPFVEVIVLRVTLLIVLVGILAAAGQLLREVAMPRWFSSAWMLLMPFTGYFVNRAAPPVDELYGSVDPTSLGQQKQTLILQIERLRKLLRFAAAPGIVLCVMPLLVITAARIDASAIPVVDGRMMLWYVALLAFSAGLVVVARADNRRQVRNLQQQLDNLV